MGGWVGGWVSETGWRWVGGWKERVHRHIDSTLSTERERRGERGGGETYHCHRLDLQLVHQESLSFSHCFQLVLGGLGGGGENTHYPTVPGAHDTPFCG